MRRRWDEILSFYIWIDRDVPHVAVFATLQEYGNPKVVPNKNHVAFDHE